MRRLRRVSGDGWTANGPDRRPTTCQNGRERASGSLVVNTGEMGRKRTETKTENYYKSRYLSIIRALSHLPDLWYNVP